MRAIGTGRALDRSLLRPLCPTQVYDTESRRVGKANHSTSTRPEVESGGTEPTTSSSCVCACVCVCVRDPGPFRTRSLSVSFYLLHTQRTVCLSVCLSVCLFVRPSIRLSVCLSVCLSVHFSFLCLSSLSLFFSLPLTRPSLSLSLSFSLVCLSVCCLSLSVSLPLSVLLTVTLSSPPSNCLRPCTLRCRTSQKETNARRVRCEPRQRDQFRSNFQAVEPKALLPPPRNTAQNNTNCYGLGGSYLLYCRLQYKLCTQVWGLVHAGCVTRYVRFIGLSTLSCSIRLWVGDWGKSTIWADSVGWVREWNATIG